MGRIRTIKPELPQSQSLARLDRDARLCFILLWTLADDSGRFRGNPRMLASLLFPYDLDAAELMEGWLAGLEEEGCIRRYVVDRADYFEICNWSDHQKIDKRSASKFPAPPIPPESSPNPREEKELDQGPRTKDQGPGTKDQGDPPTPSGGGDGSGLDRFEEFWDAFAHKQNRPGSERAWRSLKPKRPQTRAELLAVVIDRARAYAASTPELRYRKHPATWLRARGWEDELVPQSATGPPTQQSFADKDYRKGGGFEQEL